MRLQAGNVRLAGRFVNDKVINKKDRNLYIGEISVTGPKGGTKPNYPELHRRIIFTEPSRSKTVRQAATEVLAKFARRAFRRPVGGDEVAKYVNLAVATVDDGGTYNEGIELGVQAILVSPNFLFRVETDPKPDDPTGHAVNDFELASRLSYFLWSSMPDEQLMSLAESGRLHEPDTLAAQTRRMLKDPKAKSLTDNFAMQWLNLRMLDEITPDPDQFKSFDQEAEGGHDSRDGDAV